MVAPQGSQRNLFNKSRMCSGMFDIILGNSGNRGRDTALYNLSLVCVTIRKRAACLGVSPVTGRGGCSSVCARHVVLA